MFFGALAALGFAYVFIKHQEGDVTLETVADFLGAGRGSKLNNTSVNDEGFVPDDPYDLLNEAREKMGYDIEQDVYALARSGRSEGKNGMEARMHVMMRQAEESHSSVWDLTLRQLGSPKNGFFGTQRGRRWASSRDPYEGDVKLAEKVYIEHNNGIDPTGGASRFVDKSAFGKQEGTRTYAEVEAQWRAEGYKPYSYPDASSDFVLFKRG